MNNQNICKFVLEPSENPLSIVNFVYENSTEISGQIQMHNNPIMYLVIHGEGTYTTELFEKPLKPGMLFFSFAGEAFSIENTGELQYMYIAFGGERAEQLLRRFGITPANCMFPGFETLGPLWKESLTRAGSENIDLFSESMLLYAFSKLKESEHPCNQTLNQMLKLTEARFSDYTFNLSSMAELMGYNAKYLSRLFRKEMGSSFSEYLTTVRMKHAVFLMEQGVTAVSNLAVLSGYSDSFYFSKVFKKQMGISPREYRAMLQQKRDS